MLKHYFPFIFFIYVFWGLRERLSRELSYSSEILWLGEVVGPTACDISFPWVSTPLAAWAFLTPAERLAASTLLY